MMRPLQPSRFREARALIGWLDAAEAQRALSRASGNGADPAVVAARCEQARQAALARVPGIDAANAVLDPPPSLDGHIEKLRKDPILSRSFDDGWDIRMVDLTKVSPVQGYVFTDHPLNGDVQSAPCDPASLANLTLPIRPDVDLPFQYSRDRHAWIFTSDDFNLREFANFHTKIAPATGTFGFVVSLAPSVMRVILCRDRFVLQDGTHRAYGLLRRGISHAPVFFRKRADYPEVSDRPAMLPEAGVLGPHPPFLTDFLRPELYTVVPIPLVKRMLIIQATELSILA